MRTLAILILTLSTLVLNQDTNVDAAHTTKNGQKSSTTISNNETQKVQETTSTPRIINGTATMPPTGETAVTPTVSSYNETTKPATGETAATSTVSSQSPSQSTVTSKSTSPTNFTQLSKTSSSSANTTTASPKGETGSKMVLGSSLLFIFLVLLLVGCIYGLWIRRSTADDSTPRLLLSMRERVRAGISNLGDRIGVVLWPGSKREGEDDDDEEAERKQGDVEEGGQERDDGGNSEGQDGRGEQSDSSDDYSSMEGKDLQGMALRRQEDEVKKQSGDEDEDEGSIPSDGRHNPAQHEENGKKEGGLEEVVLINSPTEEDENAELCDETVF